MSANKAVISPLTSGADDVLSSEQETPVTEALLLPNSITMHNKSCDYNDEEFQKRLDILYTPESLRKQLESDKQTGKAKLTSSPAVISENPVVLEYLASQRRMMESMRSRFVAACVCFPADAKKEMLQKNQEANDDGNVESSCCSSTIRVDSQEGIRESSDTEKVTTKEQLEEIEFPDASSNASDIQKGDQQFGQTDAVGKESMEVEANCASETAVVSDTSDTKKITMTSILDICIDDEDSDMLQCNEHLEPTPVASLTTSPRSKSPNVTSSNDIQEESVSNNEDEGDIQQSEIAEAEEAYLKLAKDAATKFHLSEFDSSDDDNSSADESYKLFGYISSSSSDSPDHFQITESEEKENLMYVESEPFDDNINRMDEN